MKCTGNRLSRRNVLTVGAIGGLGLSLADFFQLRAVRGELKRAETMSGQARKDALTQLATQLHGEAPSSPDAAKVHTLATAVGDLSSAQN